jgi:hypothetical protein
MRLLDPCDRISIGTGDASIDQKIPEHCTNVVVKGGLLTRQDV